MKSKFLKTSLICLLVIVMVSALFVAAACNKEQPDSPSAPNKIKLQLTAETIAEGEEVDVYVVTLDDNAKYTVTTSDPSLVAYDNGKLVVVGTSSADKVITVTATLEDGTKSEKQITYKASSSSLTTVALELGAETIRNGEQVTVMAVSLTGSQVEVTTSHPELVAYQNGKLVVVGSSDKDEIITVIATLQDGTNATATKTITYKTSFNPSSVIQIELAKSSIRTGQRVDVTVTVKDNQAYTVTTDKPTLVDYDKGELVAVGAAEQDTNVTVTAHLNSDPTVKVSTVIQYIADDEVISLSPVSNATAYVNLDGSVKLDNGGEFNLGVSTSKGSAYFITVGKDDAKYLTIEGNTIKSTGANNIQRTVYVTVALQDDVSVSIALKVIISGNIDKQNNSISYGGVTFTTDMLASYGNASVTAIGTVSDVMFTVATQQTNRTVYDYTVKMEDGKWYGAWNHSGNKANVLENTYYRGTEIVKDWNGVQGNAMQTAFINKNNQLEKQTITNYNSVPSIWDTQHLWNCLGDLAAYFVDFEVEEGLSVEGEYSVFSYTVDVTNEESLYLMTYLSFAFTPIMSDTIETISFYITPTGELHHIEAQTETIYYGASDSDNSKNDHTALSYSVFSCELSGIGTTLVSDPAPYTVAEEEKAYNDMLKAALEKMQNATNYAFHAVDTTTYKPEANPDDYQTDSASLQRRNARIDEVTSGTVGNTVGLQGVINAEQGIILMANTGKYDYGLDENLFHTSWSGYINYDVYKGYGNFTGEAYPANTYDHFTKTKDGYVGDQKTYGSVADLLPAWDFSAELFKLTGALPGGASTFTLRESAIIRDIAMETSMHNYATDAEASSGSTLSITLDKDGNIVSVTYPYSLVEGTYLGYITTTFSDVGTTVFEQEKIDTLFSAYTPRVWRTSWDQYIVRDYSDDFTTITPSYEESADTVLKILFGDNYADILPSPEVLLGMFDDNISGPFYDWREVGTDANGDPVYHGYITLTARSTEFDENAKVTNYEEICASMATALTEANGWTLDQANTREFYNSTGQLSSRYVTYANADGISITLENNGTKNFWIMIYRTGDWAVRS